MYSTRFFIIIFRKALFPERLPNLKPKITKRANRHKSSLVNSWCLPFPGSDRSVMMRTQRARYHTDNKRPVQISSYVQISSLFWVAMWTILGYFFGILANYKLGRTLLEACPGFFSSGTVSKQVYKNKLDKAKFLKVFLCKKKFILKKKEFKHSRQKKFHICSCFVIIFSVNVKKILTTGFEFGYAIAALYFSCKSYRKTE